jgi:hypothetical protein
LNGECITVAKVTPFMAALSITSRRLCAFCSQFLQTRVTVRGFLQLQTMHSTLDYVSSMVFEQRGSAAQQQHNMTA